MRRFKAEDRFVMKGGLRWPRESRRPLGISILAVFCAVEAAAAVVFASLAGIARWYVLAGAALFVLIGYGMWRLDNRARWAFVGITSMSGFFLFDGLQRKTSDAVVVGIWLWIVVYLMLPKVRLAFSGGSVSPAPAKGTSATYRAAFNHDQVQRPVTRLQAKHFFTSRILEQARTDKSVELTSHELEFLNFQFRDTATWATTHAHDGKLFTPRGLRLSTLLEHALHADRKNAVFPAEADTVYLRRWRALREPWFKRLVVDRWYSTNPDVLLYDIVHRALGKHRAFWSSLDWFVAVFSVISCLLMIAFFVFVAVFLKSQ